MPVLDAAWVSENDISLGLIVDHFDLVGDTIWSCRLEVTMCHAFFPEAMSLLTCAALFVNTIAISVAKLEPAEVLIPVAIESPALPMRYPLLDMPFIEVILIIDVEPAEPIGLIVDEPPLDDAVPPDLDPAALSLPVTLAHLANVDDRVHQAESVD